MIRDSMLEHTNEGFRKRFLLLRAHTIRKLLASSSQVEKWPTNPVDRAIQWIRARDPSLVIADLGCGEARIAATVPNTVHSFDLVARNSHGTMF